MRFKKIDHIALHVANLAKSIAFYDGVLELERLPRPDFSFPGAWFRLGDSQALHLIAGRESAVSSGSRGNHVALGVESLEAVERVFMTKGVPHTPRKTRPDGVAQLFVEDPDGHCIEFCETAR